MPFPSHSTASFASTALRTPAAAFRAPAFLGRCAALAGSALVAVAALAALPSQAADFVSIRGASVNVREAPTTRSPVLWELGAGYPLQVTQRRGAWIKVRDHEETLGWVSAGLTSKQPHRVVTARTAVLRAGPGVRHPRLGLLERHEVVRTLRTSGDWAHVQREDGRKGWVARRLTWGW